MAGSTEVATWTWIDTKLPCTVCKRHVEVNAPSGALALALCKRCEQKMQKNLKSRLTYQRNAL